jgi:hypothetical protein
VASLALLSYGGLTLRGAYLSNNEFNRNPSYRAALDDSNRLRSFSASLSRIEGEFTIYSLHENMVRNELRSALKDNNSKGELDAELRDVYASLPSYANTNLKKIKSLEKRANEMADERLKQIPEDLRPKDFNIGGITFPMAMVGGASGLALTLRKRKQKKAG